jgi:hypothetical protein
MIPAYERPPSRWPEPTGWLPCGTCGRRLQRLYACSDGILRCKDCLQLDTEGKKGRL